jgi:hypothetical protein
VETYEIKGSDGKTYTIQGPAGASQDFLKNFIESQIRADKTKKAAETFQEKIRKQASKSDEEIRAEVLAQQPEYDAKAYNFDDNFLGGFGEGYKGTFESGALGFAAQFNEETETGMRDSILETSDKIGKFFKDTPIGYQVQDDDSVMAGIGRALGSVAGFLTVPAITAGTAMAAPVVAPAAGIAALVGTGALGFLGASGEASERARAAGASVEEREKAASLLNPKVLAAGGIEVLPLGRFVDLPLLTTLTNKLGPELSKKIANYAGRSVISGTMEGAQEAASQFLQNLNEREYNELQTLAGGIGESATYGGGAGTITQLLQDILTPRSRIARRDYLRKTKEELELEAERLEQEVAELESKTKIQDTAKKVEELSPDQITEASKELGIKTGTETGVETGFTPARVKFLQDGIVTKELLDELGVSKNAGLRKRIQGKNYSDSAVAADFDKYMANVQVKKETKANIKNLLDEIKPKETETKPEVTTTKSDLKEVKPLPDLSLESAKKDIDPELVKKTETEKLDAPRDTSDDVQLIKVEEGKIVPDTSGETEIAGQKIEPRLELPPTIDATITPTDTDPRLEIADDTKIKNIREDKVFPLLKEPKVDTTKKDKPEDNFKKILSPSQMTKQINQQDKDYSGAMYLLPSGKVGNAFDSHINKANDAGYQNIEEYSMNEGVIRMNTPDFAGPGGTAITKGAELNIQILDEQKITPQQAKSVEQLINRSDSVFLDIVPRKNLPPSNKGEVSWTANKTQSLKDKSKIIQEFKKRAGILDDKIDKKFEERLEKGEVKLTPSKELADELDAQKTKEKGPSIGEIVKRKISPIKKAEQIIKQQQQEGKLPEGFTELSKKELSKKLQSKLTKEEVNIQKDIAPIIKEVKDTAPVIEALDKRKDAPLNKIETAVVDNIRQEEEKIKPKGGFKIFTKKEVAIKEEAEQIENVQRYTIEDTVYKEGDKLPRGKKVGDKRALPKGKKIGDVKIASEYSQNRTMYSEPFNGRTKAGKPIRSEDIILETNDEKQLEELVTKPISQKEIDTPSLSPKASARMYFLKQVEPGDAMEVIAHELVYGNTSSYRKQPEASEAANVYLEKTGTKTAKEAEKWIKQNLSERSVKAFNDLKKKLNKERLATLDSIDKNKSIDVTDQFESKAKVTSKKKKEQASIKEQEQEDLYAYQLDKMKEDGILSKEVIEMLEDDVNLKELLLTPDAVSSLAFKLTPTQISLLKQGSLDNAVSNLSLTADDRTAKIALKLKNLTTDAKVEIVDNLKDEGGNPAAGIYDYKTNTIKLDSKTGLNSHTLLHELVHAATSLTLANKSHPLTKKLETLFNEVKPNLDTAYGARDLQDFVSEVMSNPEFQQRLAGMNHKGGSISALQKFFNAIGNFVRKLIGQQPKEIDSALNQSDALINAILYPRPDSTRGTGELLNNSKDPKSVFDAVAEDQKIFSATKEEKNKFYDKLLDLFPAIGDVGVKGIAYSVGLQSVSDLAQRVGIKSAPEVYDLVLQKTGREGEYDTIAEGAIQKVQKHFNRLAAIPYTSARKQKKLFDKVVYGSTLAQVDPSKLRKDYEGDTEKGFEGKTKAELWDELNPLYESLGTDGQEAYKAMRDAYVAYYKQLEKVLYGRIDDLVSKEQSRVKLKKEIYDRFFKKAALDPYFPLTRTGAFWITYNIQTPTGKEPVWESFETRWARGRAMRQLRKTEGVDVPSIQKYENRKFNFKTLPADSFIASTVNILKDNNVDQGAVDDLVRMFIDSLPETSFVKSFKKREGRLGFEEDALGAFRTKTFDLGRQIARFEFAPKFSQMRAKLDEDFKENRSAYAKIFADEIEERLKFALDPPPDGYAAAANRLAFLGTIGFNTSSSIVNLSQIQLMFVPILSGKYGFADANIALGNAARIIGASGISRKLPVMGIDSQGNVVIEETVDAKGSPSIDNYYTLNKNGDLVVREDLDFTFNSKESLRLEELKTLVDIAGKRGLLSRSLEFDTLGIEQAKPNRTIFHKVNYLGAYTFHQVEKYNRQVALTSTYLLELDKMKAEGKTIDQAAKEEAAHQAIYQMTEMNGGNTLATAPRIAQQGIGRVAMMYKSYGIQMYYTMIKTFKNAVAGESKEVRDIAQKQFLGILGSSLLLAGVQGMPLFGTIALLYSIMPFGQEDDEPGLETITRQYIGEGAYKGLVNHFTGVDVATRMGLSNLLFRTNQYNKDQDIRIQALMAAGGPALSLAWQGVTGIQDIRDGYFERGVEKMLPAAFRNAYKGAIRYPREGIKTKGYDDIISREDLTFGDFAAQVIGFTPTKATLTQEINADTKGIERAIMEKRSKLLKKLNLAYKMRDGSYKDIMKDIKKFNERHPYSAITSETIQKSIMTKTKVSSRMQNGVTISPKLKAEIDAHVRNYWGGSN